ncbi:Sec23-binding domain of Sec16-domain-containing protein [Syncephalastrum racemosum]|uniref:Protein transport protein sec16 n=1 Tax=Syncephalastrum racemosum TaxID=13706 RepID=A0A1X2HA27_SYNRA|nr:Sec23-binding domain of Sec16-domain-containing protein [Syncephalastrum racemosum]
MVDNAPTDPYAATYAPEQYPAQTISDQYGGETAAAAAAAADMYEPAGQHALPPDPLQRARGCPLVSFGFGGKLCVMFPQTVQRFTQQDGYDGGAPITKTMPSVIKIKKLRDVMDEPTVSSLSQFVGPALMDSKMGAKSKKKEVLAYMDRRINDMSALQEPHAETRVLLWRLVKLLIEKETSIGDADKTDAAVRELVQPASALETDDQGNFSVPAYAQVETRDEDAENRERAQKVLDKLQHYLLTGDRSGAVDYAMQEDLWAHALIISSCVNKDVWKNVVNNFVERELSESAGGKPRQDRYNVTGDKQALRVLYSLFAGSGGAAISEFLHKPSNTPFIGAATGGQIQVTDEQLSQWQVTLTLILANRTPHDAEAITALGDILRTHGWLAAAHICYLVAPQTSIHSGIDTPNVRLTLLGSEGGATFAQLDAYLLTELFELAVCTKQGGPAALPFLQGYKLVHAWWLADFGYLAEAQRYCEAIANAIKAYTKGSPYLHHRLLESLKEFSELCEVSGGQKLGGDAGSWLKNKLSKNSLDSLWGSLEGKFNKFVSGEDIPAEEAPVRKSTEIMANPYDAAVDGPPARSASAFDFRNANRVGVESLRRAATPTASMVSEAYMRRASSPGAHAAAGQFGRGFTPLGDSSEPQQQQQQAPYGSPSAVPDMYSYGAQPANATMSPFGHPQQQQQPSSYYGADESSYQPYQYDQPVQDHATSSYYGNDPYQPQDTQEQQPEQAPAYGTNEYGHAAPSYESYAAQTAPATTVEDDDDLGFGNSALNKPKSGLTTSEEAAPDRTQSSPPEVQSESTSGASDKDGENKEEKKGWGLFSIFSRSSTPSNQKEEKKAVKANLGEESSFYYDKEAGRWVNKTAGAQEEKPAPLPPPPKATPSKTSSPAPPPSGTSTPPPPPSGATTPGGGPPGMPRATSASSLGGPSTPPLSAMSPPPSGSGRRAGGRKPMRSRYVDVFNQPS